MLNNRCSQILKLLINSKIPISIHDISIRFNISSRTVRYDLDRIDDYLKENNLPFLIRRPNKGISILINDREEERLKNLIGTCRDSYDYVMSKNERMFHIISRLIGKEDYITINSLADDMFVSRGTVVADLKKVKDMLNSNDINLACVKGKGIKAYGDENNLRRIASNIIFEGYDENDKFNTNLMNMFKDIDMEFISNVIKDAENQMGNTLSDYAFNNLLIHIAISIKRLQLSKDILMDEKELDNLIRTPEFSIASGITKMIEDKYNIEIPKSEIGYIAIHLLGSNVMDKEEDNNEYLYVQLVAATLIESVQKNVKYDLFMDSQLLEGLIQHIKPMLYRLIHKINISNPLINDIMIKYKDVFEYVEKGIDFLKNDLNIKLISNEEIGYIVLHFMASLERIQNKNKKKPKVLVVCATGIGTSKLLAIKLKSVFDIDIVDTVSSHEVRNAISGKNIDFIVSTIEINDKDIKSITVNAFLTERDISRLTILFSNWRKENTEISYRFNEESDLLSSKGSIEINDAYDEQAESKVRELKNIMSIIKKNCTVNDYDKLKDELSTYLTIYKKEEKPKLKDILNYDFIRINEEASDWKEAIIKGGNILLQNRCITKGYIDAMIDNFNNIGPYMVILPGIAMPHAMPKYGSYKIGVSIMTLKKPVCFGKSENNPVKLILTLSVIDNTTHINILKEIMKIIEEESFMNNLSKAKTKADILDIFSAH